MSRFYRTMVFLFGWFFRLIFRVKVVHAEREPKDRPFLLCCNHTSLFDVCVIALALKNQIRFVAKKEAFKIPLIGLFIRGMGAIPVDRKIGDVGAIKKAIHELKDGHCVGLFPQGTRCPYQKLTDTPVKDGLGMIQAHTDVGVLPICIQTKVGKIKAFRRTNVMIGEYVEPSALVCEGLPKERYKTITEIAFAQTIALYDEEVKR